MTHDERLIANPFKKWPRNLPCFCGSGRKFKKCCDDKMSRAVKVSDFKVLKEDFDRILTYIKERVERGVNYKLKKPIL